MESIESHEHPPGTLREFLENIARTIERFTQESEGPRVTQETLVHVSKEHKIPMKKLCEIAGMQGILISESVGYTLQEFHKNAWKKGITRFLTWALYYEQKEEISYVNAHEYWKLGSAIGIAWEIYIHEIVALYPDILPRGYSLQSADSETDAHGIDMILIGPNGEKINIQFSTVALKKTETPNPYEISRRNLFLEKIRHFNQSGVCDIFMVFAGPCGIKNGFLHHSDNDPYRHHLAIFRYGNHSDGKKIREQLRIYLKGAFRSILQGENFHSEDKTFGVMLHKNYSAGFRSESDALTRRSRKDIDATLVDNTVET